MAENSKIEWTSHTFNPWRGCTKVSAGCAQCYAEKLSGRNPQVFGEWGPNGTRVITSETSWKEPLRWNRRAAEARTEWERAAESARLYQRTAYDAPFPPPPEHPRVFCASLADVFEGPETMPAASVAEVNKARARLFNVIALTPHLDWLLLTKRPQNWQSVLGEAWNVSPTAPGGGTAGGNLIADWLDGKPPANVWMGTSVENQDVASLRIPELLNIPAALRFLSCEPLLGPLELTDASITDKLGGWLMGGVDWVIVGGESGPHARPMHPDWARSIRDQCVAAGVAYFFKQWGEYVPQDGGGHFSVSDKKNHTIDELGRLDVPHGGGQLLCLRRVGKKNAGRLLDGREWNEFPEVSA